MDQENFGHTLLPGLSYGTTPVPYHRKRFPGGHLKGLDYPGVGPEHAYLHDIGRAKYVPVTDDEAVNAFEYLAKTEGIIPAIESSHAVAYAMKLAPTMDKDKIIVVTVSGRGDKDCAAIARYRGENIYE